MIKIKARDRRAPLVVVPKLEQPSDGRAPRLEQAAMPPKNNLNHKWGARISPERMQSFAGGVRVIRVARFLQQGEYWTLSYGDEQSVVRHRKGLHYIACLLCYPQREIHELAGLLADRGVAQTNFEEKESTVKYLSSEHEECLDGVGDAGELLDNEAKCANRRRLLELAEELKQAKHEGRLLRVATLEIEQKSIQRELRRAFGPGGCPRRAASAAERARVNVTRGLNLTIDLVRLCSPRLGRHLKDSIRTGYFCSYRPDPSLSISWQL